MSSDEILGAAPKYLLAALVWDVPTLSRAESEGAKAFARAFGPPRQPEAVQDQSDPLAEAAEAVALVRTGEFAESASHVEQLIARNDPWERLLGLSIDLWSAGSDNSARLDEAEAIVRRVDDNQLRARLLNKLSLFAFDKAWHEAGIRLLAAAIEDSALDSRLRRALVWAGFGHGISNDLPTDSAGERDDPLVAQSWIQDAALVGANKALMLSAEDSLQGTWSWTIRMGATPVDELVAAEVQATWAGAHWLRPSIRKQLGALLLTGAASSPEQWSFGLVMWSLGGGKHLHEALRKAEPHLDIHSADFIVRSLADEPPGRYGESRFVTAALAAWDLISEGLVEWMFELVPVIAGEDSRAEDSQRLWAALLWRDPSLWAQHYERLDEDQRRSLVAQLAPTPVKELPIPIQQDLLGRCRDLIGSGSREEWAFYLAFEIATHLGDDQAREFVLSADPPATALSSMAEQHPEAVPFKVLEAKERQLIEIVERQAAEARDGKIGFGGRSPRVVLGSLTAHIEGDPPAGVAALLSVSGSPELPPQFRAEALQGLALIHRGAGLPDDALEAIRKAPLNPEPYGFEGDYTEALLDAYRLEALAPAFGEDERISLVRYCRDPDRRVRVIAMACSSLVLAQEANEALAWAMVAGLFDPEQDVVEHAVAGVGRGDLRAVPEAQRVALDRLPRLFSNAGRHTRAEVVRAIRRLSTTNEAESEDLVFVVLRATEDRSWGVRRSAAAADEI